MASRLILFSLLLVAAATRPAEAALPELVLFCDADGTTYIRNLTDAPVSFTGYGIVSPESVLQTADWRSIADWIIDDPTAVTDSLGSQATGFTESTVLPSLLAEKSATGVAVLPEGRWMSIGKLFKTFADFVHSTATAYYTVPGSADQLPMEVARLPEPSTWLLALFAAAGLFALRHRTR
jgi:hypothetical protein